jgi:uncharacterized protein (TIGR03085 family)
MPTPLDERERQSLCDLLDQLGPDAPTLCEGWTTADMAAHLVLREHFHRWPEAKLAATKAKGYTANVAKLRGGAPLVPWRLPGVRSLINGSEYAIHHEDVRRANGMTRRTDVPEVDDALWRAVGLSARRVAKGIRPWSLQLRADGRDPKRYGSGEGVSLVGPASEIALYLSGRRQGAEVTVEGTPEAVAALEKANGGF